MRMIRLKSGFTLVELLMSLLIVGVVITGAFLSMKQYRALFNKQEQKTLALIYANRVYQFINNDVQNAIPSETNNAIICTSSSLSMKIYDSARKKTRDISYSLLGKNLIRTCDTDKVTIVRDSVIFLRWTLESTPVDMKTPRLCLRLEGCFGDKDVYGNNTPREYLKTAIFPIRLNRGLQR